MSNFFNLLKTFIKTTELTSAEKKRSKHFYTIMGTAVVLLIMIPAGALVGIITYALTLGVMTYGGAHRERSNFTYYFYPFRSIRN